MEYEKEKRDKQDLEKLRNLSRKKLVDRNLWQKVDS